MLSCGPLSRRDSSDPLWTSANLAERKIFIPDEFRVQARSSAEELRQIAAAVAEKLNGSKEFMVKSDGLEVIVGSTFSTMSVV